MNVEIRLYPHLPWTNNYPELYKEGQQKIHFNFKVFWRWIIFAAIHGAITFWACEAGFLYVFSKNGVIYGHWFTSTLAFTIVIHIVTLKMLVESYYYNYLVLVATVIGLLFYYISVIVLNIPVMANSFNVEIKMLFFQILATPVSWIVIIFLPLIALSPDYIYASFNFLFYPSKVHLVMRKPSISQVFPLV